MSDSYQSVVYQAPEGSEVLGVIILPYFDNLASDKINPILKSHNLSKEDIDPEGWYPLQLLADISKEASPTGTTPTDIALGKSYSRFVIEQYKVTSIEQYFDSTLGDIVLTGIRNVPEGYGFDVKKLGDRHYQITNNTLMSNGLYYGAFWEICRILRPDDVDFTVEALSGLGADDYLTPGVFDVTWG